MTLDRFSLLIKLACLCLLYFLHGSPFVGFAEYLFCFFSIFYLWFGKVRNQSRAWLIILGIGFLIFARMTPTLEIPEQQRIMLDEKNDYISIQDYMKTPNNYPFQISGDGYMQGYLDKRMVRTIDIADGVISLRNSLINLRKYNFYKPHSLIERRDMPFVVVYEIVPSMVGMTIHGIGSLYLQKNMEAAFKPLPQEIMITVTPEYIGSKIMGFGGAWSDLVPQKLNLSLEKTGLYVFYENIKTTALFAGALLLFIGLFTIPKGRDFKFKLLLLTLSVFFLGINYPDIFRLGVLVQGGGDGVIHDGDGHWMLEFWSQGQLAKALMSPETVFYFMPGARYLRFLELLIFGDAYILRISLLVFMPVIFYCFFRLFLKELTSFALGILVIVQKLLDHIGLSLKLYTASTLNLYGEGMAYGFLFMGIVLLLNNPVNLIRRSLGAFFLFSIAISMRPNLLVFVGVLSAIHLFTKTFSNLPWHLRFSTLFGLSPILLIPLHNIIGGNFVLLTSASNIPQNLSLAPVVYLQGLTNILGLTSIDSVAPAFFNHFKRIYPNFILAGAGCLWISIKEKEPQKKALAFATFCGIFMHLFYLPILRYIHPYLTIAVVLGLSYASEPLERWLLRRVADLKEIFKASTKLKMVIERLSTQKR